MNQKSLSISDLKIEYFNLDNSVRNNARDFFLNQGAVTVKVHTQIRIALSTIEKKKAVINHL